MRLTAEQVPARIWKLFLSWGIDKAIAFTVIARGWSVLAGPVTLLFLAAFLSPEEQGFYYTFASILALQVFFELGLSFVILQFASHERAGLEWAEDGTLTGDQIAKSRLSSLLKVSLTWYSVVAVLVVLVVLPAGFVFFGSQHVTGTAINWQLPWVLIVLVTAGTLCITPFYAVLQGLGQVEQVAFIQVCQNVAGSLLLWFSLSQGWGLFATPLFLSIGLVWGVCWLYFKKRRLLLDLLHKRSIVAGPEGHIGWWGEVWPFQWKIAVSWVSGYFIFQLFNPVLFAFYGPIAAGQMGMSISIMNSISTVAIAWVDTKAAPFGSLIAKGDFKMLDRLFFPCLRQSLAVLILGGAAFWLGSLGLHLAHLSLAQRILDPLPMGLLLAAAIVNHIVFAQAVYLRAHKQEPFLWLSITIAVLVGLSTYFLGQSLGATGMMAGYFVVNLILGLGAGTAIFIRKRHLWHAEPVTTSV